MKKLLCAVMVLGLFIGVTGCSSNENESAKAEQTTEDEDISLEEAEEIIAKHSIENTEKENQEEGKFVAKGETALMPFLNSSDRTGYSIIDPVRDDEWVTATLKKVDTGATLDTINIKYFVEDQHVFNVSVIADSEATMGTSDFQDAVVGMAKAINPDVDEDTVISAFNEATSSNEAVVKSDMQFLINNDDYSCSISY